MLQHRNEGARQDGLERRSGASPTLIAPICRRIHRQESCKPPGDWRVVEPTVRIELTTNRLQSERTAFVLRWHDAPGRLKPLSIKSGKPLPGDWQAHCHERRFFLLETAGEVRPVPVESLVPRLADYASNCHDRVSYSNADHVAPATGDLILRPAIYAAPRTRLTCVPGYPLPA